MMERHRWNSIQSSPGAPKRRCEFHRSPPISPTGEHRVTVVIADDEPAARAGLRDIVSGIEWLQVVGEASNGPAAVEMINRLKPELVFLDIQMPGLLGTEVLRHITHQPFV